MDDDHDGYVHYTEFLASTLETAGEKLAEERLAEAFNQLDMDDTRHISKANLIEFLGRDCEVCFKGSEQYVFGGDRCLI